MSFRRVLMLALACLGLAAPAAHAAGGGSLGLGFTDDNAFLQGSAAAQGVWLGRAHALGSQWIRLGVLWDVVAPPTPPRGFRASDPGDPNYRWEQLDQAVRDAVSYGQTPMLSVHAAPRWAEGAGMPSWAPTGSWLPSASAFRAFGQALAARYSGHFPDPLYPGRRLPRVRYFQAWNEPNLVGYLTPQWVADAHGRPVAYSPGLYRSLLNGFYAGVKRGQKGAVVFAAGTAPFGDAVGQDRMAPKTFLEGLFCLNAALRRTGCPGGAAHLDGLDHHSYSPPWYAASSANDIAIPDLQRIWTVLGAARRAHTVAPNGPKPLWITEVGTSSAGVGLSGPTGLAQQSHYLALDLYVLWREHVSNVFWFSIVDPGPSAGSFFAEGGLFTDGGAIKPAAAAYRFPFVAVPASRGRLTVWGKAPSRGMVSIERLGARGWTRVLRLRTSGGRIFTATIGVRGKPQFRAVIGGAVSLPWTAGR